MNLRKKHSKKLTITQAKTERVFCDTQDLKALITNWMENEGWTFESFADFLKLVGVSIPVKLTNLNKKENSFSCISADNKDFVISLRFGSFFDYDSEIHVTYGEYTKSYTINQNLSKGDTKPSVTLLGKTIKKNDKEFSILYFENSISTHLTINNKYILDIYINGPFSSFELKNLNLLEDYLITIDGYVIATSLCNKIMKVLDFSFNDVSKCSEISVSISEKNGDAKVVRSKVIFSYGVLQQYATTENNETFWVFRNGYWSYHSDNMTIEAPLNANRTIHITDSEEEPYNGKLNETLARITGTINSLKLLFKEN